MLLKVKDTIEKVFLSRAKRYFYQENNKFFHLDTYDPSLLEAHLSGKLMLGVIPDVDDFSVYGCFDIDFKEGDIPDKEKILLAKKEIFNKLTADGYKPLIEISKSGIGYHIWLVFSDLVDRYLLQKYMSKVLASAGFGDKSKNGVIEIFPKGKKGGNGVWLPYYNTFSNNELEIKELKSVFVDINDSIDVNIFDSLSKIASHNFNLFKNNSINQILNIKELPPCFSKAKETWKKGYRDGLAVAISGIAKKELKWSKEDTFNFVNAIAINSNDEELKQRQVVVNKTFISEEVAGCSIMQGKNETITLPETFCSESCFIYQNKLKKQEEKKEKLNTHELALKLLESYKVYTESLDGDIWLYNSFTGLWTNNGNEILQNYLETSSFLEDKYKTTHYITNIMASVRRITIDLTGEGFPEANPMLIPFKNGVYNLETKYLEPYRPDMYLTSQLPWNYNPSANTTYIDVLIKGFTKNPKKLMELLACVLYRDYSKCQYIWFLKGSGANGKSLFMKLLRRFVGEKNVSAVSLEQLLDNRFMLSNLYNKWVNDGQELPVTTPIDKPNVLKSLTGDYIEADRKYKGTIRFKNNAKLIFYGNHLPKTLDTSKGFFRRVVVIDFPYAYDKLPKNDPRHRLVDLAFKKDQIEGLLVKVVETLSYLIGRDFKLDTSLDESWRDIAKQYEADSNPLRKFIDVYCVREQDEDYFIAKYEFRDAFNAWMTKTGMSNPYPRDNEFHYAMKDMGFEDAKKTFNTEAGPKRYNAWLGIRWKSSDELTDVIEGEEPPPLEIVVDEYLQDAEETIDDPLLLAAESNMKGEVLEMPKVSALLSSYEEVLSYVNEKEMFALDLETYSESGTTADNTSIFKNKIRVITVGDESTVHCLDVSKYSDEQIKELVSKFKDKKIVGHNLKMDLGTLAVKYGSDILPEEVYDTLIGSKIVHSIKGNPDDSNKLQDVLAEFLDVKMDKTEQTSNWGYKVTKLSERVKLQQLAASTPHYASYVKKQLEEVVELTDNQVMYAKKDVQYLIPLMKEQVRIINKNSTKKARDGHFSGTQDFITCTEMKFLINLILIVLAGIPVDVETLYDIERNTLLKYEKIKEQIKKEYGIDNPNSTQQVLARLKQDNAMVSVIDEETKLTKLVPIQNTSEETLLSTDHPLAKLLLELREALKLSGMIKGYTEVYEDKRLHPDFNQLVTTGRMSCSSPNVQQIPREIKKHFYKQEENKVLIKIDYPTIELRILASYLYEKYKDTQLVNNFKNEIDPHKATASALFKVPLEQVTAEQRQIAKPINFGFSYGMGISRFIESAKGYGINVTVNEATEFRNKFKEATPVLKTWHDEAANLTKQNDAVSVFTLGGRKLTAKSFSEILNFPIQGTGGDITKYAVNIFYDILKEYDLSGKINIINIVHDEIIVEADKDLKEVAESFLKQAMQISADYILKYFKTEV